MIRLSRQLYLLRPGSGVRGLVEAALSPRFQVVEAPDETSLLALLRQAAPVPVVLLPGGSLAPEETGPPRELLERMRGTATVVLIDSSATAVSELLRLGEHGAAEVLLLDTEATPTGLAARVETAFGQACMRAAERLFGLLGSARARLILPAAIGVVVEGGDARDLAVRLGVERRTLTVYCAGARLPAPRRLLAWARLLLAAEMLDEPKRAVADIARLCGYSSPNALRTAFAQFLDRSPRELRKQGAFRSAQEAFRSDRRAFRGASALSRSDAPPARED